MTGASTEMFGRSPYLRVAFQKASPVDGVVADFVGKEAYNF